MPKNYRWKCFKCEYGFTGCFYCHKPLHYDSKLRLNVCETEGCKGSRKVLIAGLRKRFREAGF